MVASDTTTGQAERGDVMDKIETLRAELRAIESAGDEAWRLAPKRRDVALSRLKRLRRRLCEIEPEIEVLFARLRAR